MSVSGSLEKDKHVEKMRLYRIWQRTSVPQICVSSLPCRLWKTSLFCSVCTFFFILCRLEVPELRAANGGRTAVGRRHSLRAKARAHYVWACIMAGQWQGARRLISAAQEACGALSQRCGDGRPTRGALADMMERPTQALAGHEHGDAAFSSSAEHGGEKGNAMSKADGRAAILLHQLATETLETKLDGFKWSRWY